MSDTTEMFPGEANTSRYRGMTTAELIRHVANQGGTAMEVELARRLDDYYEREERLEQEKEQLEDQLGEKDEEISRLNDRIAELAYLDRQQEER